MAVIWFTSSDLRVHDHDGLVASAAAAAMLPVYVFDDQVGEAQDIASFCLFGMN